MSNTDSFIDEVTEEVRRDRLYGYVRRYGWIVGLVILLIVAGTAWREYTKAQTASEMAARGDALFNALELDAPASRAAALQDVAGAAPTTGVVPLLMAASETTNAGDLETARGLYQQVADISGLDPIYRDLALFKKAMITEDQVERLSALSSLSAPGAPYRTLAEEQLALLSLERGDADAALARLQPLLQDAETSAAQQRRIVQLIVALGSTPELANGLLTGTDTLTGSE